MTRRHFSITLQQASEDAPILARLSELTRRSKAQLEAIRPLLPPGMRAAVVAGPLDGTQWCLLVQNNAAAAKLRQLQPALLAHLRTHGWAVETLRIKVQRPIAH